MSGEATKDKLRLGFLTAFEVPQRGFVGGLLVTNHFGRPLEFQCTTPVQPNRTQQILYGPTLVPFIQTELIGKTLVDKVGVKPDLILTDSRQLLDLREHIAIPVACLDDADSPVAGSSDDSQPAEESLAEDAAATSTIGIGRHTLRFHSAHRSDAQVIAAKSHLIPDGADLLEPFERVREALNEAIGTGAKR
jgi:hypothetical protein